MHDDLNPHPHQGRCAHCPRHTPLCPDPAALQRAQQDVASLDLDAGIRHAVEVLVANGVETFES
jgi:hypothetical protein